MASAHHDHQNLSLILSEILHEIGENDEMVMRRRKSYLLRESLAHLPDMQSSVSVYYYGSRSEGTSGVHSDADHLICSNLDNAIQQLDDWKPGVSNYLMVQDETTSPGYCKLQLLRNDAPVEARVDPDNEYGGFIAYLKNTNFHGKFNHLGNIVQHGPAATLPAGEYSAETDRVFAYHCESWPREGRRWLHRRSASGWPTMQLKTKAERSGCFLVPVCSKINGLNEFEWRISTCHAERYLMFSLNITHLRCYMLIKILLQSHINRGCDNVISSYMCKTAMFHCVERISFDFWCEHNLIQCLNQILREIYSHVLNNNCPHIIIPENNLMAERIPPEQQQLLLANIQHVIDNIVGVLFEINTDDIGRRFHAKLVGIRGPEYVLVVRLKVLSIINGIAYERNDIHISNLAEIVNDNFHTAIRRLLCCVERYKQHYVYSNQIEQEACLSYLPLMCSTIGSMLASFDKMQNKPVSGIALKWFEMGLNSDVSSGWLKLATANYSTGKLKNTEAILRYVEHKYDVNVVLPFCTCYDKRPVMPHGLIAIADGIQNCDIGSFTAHCMIFTRLERYIVPHEMQQEYSRSTHEEIQDRNFHDNWWMNFAVVDSLPYLFFLQYKTFGCLGNRREQETALCKLKSVIRDGRNLKHKDTALNLLGQCMEQEHQPNEAFNCYERSLQVRPRHNAAQLHRARMLS